MVKLAKVDNRLDTKNKNKLKKALTLHISFTALQVLLSLLLPLSRV